MSVQAIKKELSQLDKKEQAELMHYLVEPLAGTEFHLSDEWKAELKKREEALENGTSVGRPARDVIAKYLSN